MRSPGSFQNWSINTPGKPVRVYKSRVDDGTYLVKSLERIAIMADLPFSTSKAVVCKMIAEYGHCLADQQRELLERWCRE